MALAAAFAVVPAVAEETTQGAKDAGNEAREAAAVPSATVEPVHQAVESLHRLRLHPGQDSLDVEETARRRPYPERE